MPFIPQSEQHAIIEVVIGLTFARPFYANEIEAFAKTHNELKAELPRVNRAAVFNIAFGNNPPPTPPVGGVMFDRFKADGSIEWRLNVTGNSILVNCLSYTRWHEVWPRARDYLISAIRAVGSDDNPLVATTLQYIDMFAWEGAPEDYEISRLLDLSSDFLPSSLSERGQLWHLHQGWFVPVSVQPPRRTLKRIHIDALEQDASPMVKIDTYINLEHRLGVPIGHFTTDRFNAIFDDLHKQSTTMLAGILSEETRQRINLNVA